MNVVHDRRDRLVTEDIVVKPAARLPEAKNAATTVHHAEPLQPLGLSRLDQVVAGGASDRSFQSREDAAHLSIGSPGKKQDVHVLGHDDICPDRHGLLAPHPLERLKNPRARAISGQQRQALIAGVGQEMRVSGFVPGTASFSWKRLHGGSVRLLGPSRTAHRAVAHSPAPALLREQWHTATSTPYDTIRISRGTIHGRPARRRLQRQD